MDLFEEEKRETTGFLKLILRNFKLIVVACTLGLCAGITLTLLSNNKYRSTGTIYSSNSFTRDQIISNPSFGSEIETEQLMQLLTSQSMRDSVINKFDLISYYELDTNSIDWRYQLTLNYIADINFVRSKYMSIVIIATTKDPQLSADIVNYIIDAVNNYKAAIFKENMRNELIYREEIYLTQLAHVDSIKNTIYKLKDSTSADNIIENYLLSATKDNYEENGFINSPQLASMIDLYKDAKAELSEARKSFNSAQKGIQRPFMKNYVVDRAVPSYKRVSPSFKVNLGLGLLFGLTISLCMIIVWSRIKKIRAELKADK